MLKLHFTQQIMEKAVFQAYGRQYRAGAGDTIVVSGRAGEIGSECKFSEVLAVESDGAVAVGNPHVDGAAVHAKLIERLRGRKLRVFKMRRRKDSRSLHGHRDSLIKLQITSIEKS